MGSKVLTNNPKENDMTKTTYFKAVHSTGAVHLRSTNGTGAYKFAVVRARTAGGASFSSRIDLARREAERLARWYADAEVVPAVEIEKAEYNALLKAGAIKRTVTFRGKKFAKSAKLDSACVPTHAVGYFRPAQEARVEIGADWHPSFHEKHPEGFFMRQDREEFGVHWYTSAERAQEAVGHHAGKGYEVELFTL